MHNMKVDKKKLPHASHVGLKTHGYGG